MLFDLRGRGRRRTVRVLYTGLAVLMGAGLVLFGIGTGFGGGGFLNAASQNEGSGGTSFADQIKKYRKQTQQNPQNVAAWAALTKAQLHEAGGEAYVTTAGTPTAKGREIYKEAAQSWEHYIALNPPKPDPEVAQQMVRIYDQEGLNEPAKAVGVLQLVVTERPNSAALYAALAVNAYRAHNAQVGDLASIKAIALAPSDQRARLRNELAEAKKNPSGEQTFTTTTNGKTFLVKKAANGTYTGTAAPPKTSTTGTSTAKK
jgi:hypothetical protein